MKEDTAKVSFLDLFVKYCLLIRLKKLRELLKRLIHLSAETTGCYTVAPLTGGMITGSKTV